MYLCVFIAGMILEFFLERYARYLYRKILNPRELEADGTYKIWFRHPSGDIEEGYTKKCPPVDVSPSDICAIIRAYNKKRLKYRVFWEKR